MTLNGLDLEALTGTLSAIQADSSLADFEFRAKNQWIGGGANRSQIMGCLLYTSDAADDLQPV